MHSAIVFGRHPVAAIKKRTQPFSLLRCFCCFLFLHIIRNSSINKKITALLLLAVKQDMTNFVWRRCINAHNNLKCVELHCELFLALNIMYGFLDLISIKTQVHFHCPTTFSRSYVIETLLLWCSFDKKTISLLTFKKKFIVALV